MIGPGRARRSLGSCAAAPIESNGVVGLANVFGFAEPEAVFLAHGAILWKVGLVMGAGQFLGAQGHTATRTTVSPPKA